MSILLSIRLPATASLGLGRLAGAVRLWLAACAHRYRSRLELAELDPYLRKDIGITEGQALAEARKPCWMR